MIRVNKKSESQISACNMMKLIGEGKIRRHVLHNDTIVGVKKSNNSNLRQYSDFVKTKLCYEILNLTGNYI